MQDQVPIDTNTRRLLETPVFKIGNHCREWFLTPQEPGTLELRNVGLHLMGHSLLRPPYTMVRPYSNFHIILLPTQGELQLRVPSGLKTIRAGEVWFIPADSLSRYELKRGKVEMTWAHFGREAVSPTLHKGEGLCLAKNSSAPERMRFHLRSLQGQSHWTGPFRSEMRHKVLEILAIELRMLLNPDARNSEATSRVQRLWEQIEQAPGQNWDIPAMARKAELSPSRFHAICLECFGMTPHEKLTRIRMNRAIGLLCYSTDKIEAIAAESGYSTLFAFSKAFKKIIGSSPKTFREKAQGNLQKQPQLG